MVEIGVVMVFVGRSKYMVSVVIAVVVEVTVEEMTTIGAVEVVETVTVVVLRDHQQSPRTESDILIHCARCHSLQQEGCTVLTTYY